MMPPPLLPLLVSGKDNACSTNVDSSPTLLTHSVYRALKARMLLDQPIPAGGAGSKNGKGNSGDNNCNTGAIGRELDCPLD
jgi:hypothetical protein